ncbi:hypothetical protein E1H13_11395 [Nodosilinea sp. P-1105]|nr:hypothetical protein [Nodosilinea sp. P-1105]
MVLAHGANNREGRGQRTEDRGRRAEGGGRRAEGGGRRAEGRKGIQLYVRVYVYLLTPVT